MATRGVPQPGDVCALIAIAVQEVESGALVMSDSCVREGACVLNYSSINLQAI